MNATKLIDEQGNVKYWQCGKCGSFVSPIHKAYADTCCSPCTQCGAERPKSQPGLCYRCREDKRLNDAIEVPRETYGDPIIIDDDFYSDLGEYEEHLADNGYDQDDPDYPEFVHTSKPVEFKPLDIDHILDMEAFTEDVQMDRVYKGVDELSKAIDAFNELNAGGINYWTEDTKHKVRVVVEVEE